MKYSLRQIIGAAVIDYPQYFINTMRRGAWIRVVNRNNNVLYDPGGRGVVIDEPWSSDIYICQVFPKLGKTLFKKAVRDWPFRFCSRTEESGNVDLSFIIPHRGVDRLPRLSTVIKSIFGQRGVSVECVVVEQNQAQEAHDLPEGVRVVHLPDPAGSTSWQKCRAFNQGVKMARSDIVVCHDGDIIVPERYGHEILNLLKTSGYDVAFPQRFLFHISQSETENLMNTGTLQRNHTPTRVQQNWKGGTLAIRREAYFQIGGFDERFTGWSGEDIEFYDRCLVLNGYRFGYIPFIHLCHPEQPTKKGEGRETNFDFSNKIMSVPREQRIAQLKKIQQL
jgi:hypothetical protein